MRAAPASTAGPGRRKQQRSTPPMGRVVSPEDIVTLAVRLMTNTATAVTGATFDVDSGQQLVLRWPRW
ncbi:SDR family oxidoreductase [Streptomyces sp. NPDC046821]|uniref:SDR family oxidoreductase n=1 Tax=Streptomyces sp. NPDC046821 TaxID=3154702 RepID=UPI0033D0098E